jgi:protocatechuate 3,4-dioxygenase beta subunit
VAFAADVQVVAGAVTGGVDLTATGLVDGGSIHGTVRGEDGTALAGIEVNIYAPAGSSGAPPTAAWMRVASTQTGATGGYGFADLLPNDYVLEYRNPDGIYYTQYYGNERSIAHAQVVSIGRSEQRAAVDIMLAPGGLIEGTVLLDGSLPPAAAIVVARNVELGALSPFTASYDAQSGAYYVGGLPPGGYKVRAEVPYLPAVGAPLTGYHRAARNWDDATVITITAGSRLRSIDVVLAQDGFNGVIAGTISGDGGLPLGGMTVELYRGRLDWLLQPRLVYTTTDTGGRYRFDGLLDGFYYVRVVDPGGAYSPGYSGNEVLADLVQPVIVEKGLAPGPIDVRMLRSATLRGRVYDQDGKPVAGARVYLTAYRGSVSTIVTMTLTGADGSYAGGPLPPAQYSACAYLSRDNGNDNGCHGGRQGSGFQPSLFELLPGAVLANIDIYFGGTPGLVDQLYVPTVRKRYTERDLPAVPLHGATPTKSSQELP